MQSLFAQESEAPGWRLVDLGGRLVELSGRGATATLTQAFRLVLEAQRRGEPAAWVTDRQSSFYPPDVAEGGVDLDALVVVRVLEAGGRARAADQLARSGAFGLIVIDLGISAVIPPPLQARLLGLAQKHDTAIVALTEKGSDAPSLGSLVSLRGGTRRERKADGVFACTIEVLKDKRHAPGWTHEEVCRGPAGLR
jgi:recombination protein RecA